MAEETNARDALLTIDEIVRNVTHPYDNAHTHTIITLIYTYRAYLSPLELLARMKGR